jgi:hypothetical protein
VMNRVSKNMLVLLNCTFGGLPLFHTKVKCILCRESDNILPVLLQLI